MALLATAGVTALGISPPAPDAGAPTAPMDPSPDSHEPAATCRIALEEGHERAAPAREPTTPEATLSVALEAVKASLALVAPDADWDQIRAGAEDRLAHGDDLFDAVGAALEAMGPDARVWLRADDGRRWASPALEDDAKERASREAAMDAVATALDDVEISADGLIVSARLRDGTRYIRPRVAHPPGHSPRARHAAGQGDATDAIVSLIGRLPEGAPVVIDLRYGAEFGWQEAVALAGCFAEESGAALHVRGVDSASGSLREPRATLLEPGALARATGPVVLLTGPGTDNGAEVLALASMPSARVTRIGQQTSGDLTPARIVPLPNGWRMGVPMARLLSWNLRDYDGVGIPPHIRAENAIDGALEYLSRLRSSGLIPE